MIKLKDVSKFYYNKGVIATGFNKVNLEFNVGEFVAITGESGSGKSTLLNVLSGLDSYEEGEMYINGEETSHYSEKEFETYRRKYIGNIFQSFNLVNSYTVYQNVELVLLLNGEKRKNIKKKVIDLIKKVDLYKYRNSKVSKLSGGQKQRVAIARALAKETPIIIADEPTGNLDTKSAENVIETLYKISKDKLVIIVTHNYEQVEKYATRKITMSDGKVIEDKKIKPIESEEKAKIAEVKNITNANKLRLGIRNTFNIVPKFILVFIVYIFMTVALLSEYSSYKNAKYLSENSGYNIYFEDCSTNRIIIKKQNNTEFTEEDFSKIKQIDNVDYIVKEDLLCEYFISLGSMENDDIGGLYGYLKDIEILDNELISGRMPQNDNEIVVALSRNQSFRRKRIIKLRIHSK